MRFLLSVATVAFLLCGCGCSTQDTIDVKIFTSAWSQVSKEYRAAVQGQPVQLDADQVKARLAWCDEADAVVARRSGKTTTAPASGK